MIIELTIGKIMLLCFVTFNLLLAAYRHEKPRPKENMHYQSVWWGIGVEIISVLLILIIIWTW